MQELLCSKGAHVTIVTPFIVTSTCRISAAKQLRCTEKPHRERSLMSSFFQFLSRLKALWGTQKSREVAWIQTIIFSPFSRSSMHSCVRKKTWQNRTLLHFLLVPMWNKHTSHLLKREVSPVCKGITLPNPSHSAEQTRIHSCYHTAILLNDGLFPTGAATLGLMQQV